MISSDFRPGTRFTYKGIKYILVKRILSDKIRAEDLETGEVSIFRIHELLAGLESSDFKFDEIDASKNIEKPLSKDFSHIPEKDIAIAKSRYAIIKPILDMEKRTKTAIAVIAKNAGINTATLYRWMNRYEKHGLIGLCNWNSEKGPKGKTFLPEKTVEIVRSTIKDMWPSSMKFTKKAVYDKICVLCDEENIEERPSYGTVSRWIDLVKDEYLQQREGKEAFRKKRGSFPGSFTTTRSLEYVQIDHKYLDVRLVDPQTRTVIGRPWLTVGIDVYSHLPWGYYLSYDAPSYNSVAMTLFNGLWIKNAQCEKFGTQNKEYNVHGIPETLHLDNAREFDAEALLDVCCHYGIDIHNRQIRKPWYGAIIERFFGTLDRMVIDFLPGKTFSDPKKRGEYDSDKNALLTLEQLDTLIFRFIVDIYAHKYHEGINSTPYAKWEEGKQLRWPREIVNYDELKFKLLPFKRRTIDDGIHFEKMLYWHEYFRHKDGNEIVMRYNPKDLSCLYYEIPDTKEIVSVYATPKYREISKLSLWEVRKIKQVLREEGKKMEPEDMILRHGQLKRDAERMAMESKRAKRILERITDKDKNILRPNIKVIEDTTNTNEFINDKYRAPEELPTYDSELDYKKK